VSLIFDPFVTVSTCFAETFWIDLSIHNPLESEVTLGDLTVVVEAETEVIDEVTLNPKETRLVRCYIPFAICSGKLAHFLNHTPGPNCSHTPHIWLLNNSFCAIPFSLFITDHGTTFNPRSAAQRYSDTKT